MRLLNLAAVVLMIFTSVASAADAIVMHRDPGCGCCTQWAERVQAAFGRNVRIADNADRSALHRRAGITPEIASCHTAIVDGMVFEGHVPIADMRRVLADRPRGVRGLAVPGMPIGSPGMEVPGRSERYAVIAFGAGGQRIYARH